MAVHTEVRTTSCRPLDKARPLKRREGQKQRAPLSSRRRRQPDSWFLDSAETQSWRGKAAREEAAPPAEGSRCGAASRLRARAAPQGLAFAGPREGAARESG